MAGAVRLRCASGRAEACDGDDVEDGLDQWLNSPDVLRAKQVIASQPARVAGHAGRFGDYRSASRRGTGDVGKAGWIAFEFVRTRRYQRTARDGACARARRGADFQTGDADSNTRPAMPDIGRFSWHGPGLRIAQRCAALGCPLPVLRLTIEPPDAAARERIWRQTLPELSGHAATLAARYVIEPAVVAEIANDFRATAAIDGDGDCLEAVAECVRVRSNLRLSAGVKLVRPRARWDQLILPHDRKAQLTEGLQRLIHQGTVLDRWKFLAGRPGARGVRMLLSGPPGTGKTLAAEVVAHALGVDLMIVDISQVVSKWIGETEKHLAEAFDAAERSQAVLLFDEADALIWQTHRGVRCSRSLCESRDRIFALAPGEIRWTHHTFDCREQDDRAVRAGTRCAGRRRAQDRLLRHVELRLRRPLRDEFKIFTNINSTIVDPKNFDEKSFVDFKGDVCIIPPNSFALARTVEYFRIPRNVLTSAWARAPTRAAGSSSTSRRSSPSGKAT